jgi:hypothetical protein
MNTIRFTRKLCAASLQAALLALTAAWCQHALAGEPELLAITDTGIPNDPTDPSTLRDDSVKFFDAKTGKLLTKPRVGPNSGLAGPAAVLFWNGPKEGFVVVNQNQFQPLNGEVRRYDAAGNRLPDIVPANTDPKGPVAPRGAVLVNNKNGTRTLFLTDQGDAGLRGHLLAYTIKGKAVVGKPVNIDPRLKNPDGTEAEYHPRAVVLGPDGLLYMSQLANIGDGPAPGCGGSILRFDPSTLKFKGVVIENSALCKENKNDLHRPEGLVFSPRGDLYVTSFRQRTFLANDTARADDNDRILIISKESIHYCTDDGAKSSRTSVHVDSIDLWRADMGQDRAYAQALLFGPNGHLFVPISNTGEVRRYNVDTKHYWTFISALNSPLTTPQYLSFGTTNPATLAYGGEK